MQIRPRFKEMCHSQPAVQSLLYLQNQVSQVVDHEDPNETQLFRSLMTHLLMHSSPISASPTSPSAPENNLAQSTEPVDCSGSPIKVDLPELESGSGNHEPVLSTPPPSASERSIANHREDLFEHKFRPAGEHLSQEYFIQRTKTFEAILEFIADDAKQPAGSLLDLVDIDVEV